MCLHEVCHSIDNPDIAPILEIVKFPNSERRTAMTIHSTSFPTDQNVGPAAAEALLPAAATAPQLLPAKKLNLRKLLCTSAAIAALAGATWYGFEYWTVGRYLVSTDD